MVLSGPLGKEVGLQGYKVVEDLAGSDDGTLSDMYMEPRPRRRSDLLNLKIGSSRLSNGVLNFVQVPPPHTGEAMPEVMKRTFKCYKIERRTNFITTDNASNSGTAMELL
ncbi:hypothetical protein RvY_02034 [Ramazzottius varieornatus]|uniref:Uncharacterized protein n=1 Tax=Ramazzottius varieornatus TaxID=947166 RepID=A0A1D1UQD9_RAMVA|nr:hypothetical protein RvY_02034 [Ramazzottius varieornatus]